MLRTTDEIEKAVKTAQDNDKDLTDRQERDFGCWRLTPYDRGKDYKSFTSNQARTLANKIINLNSQAKYTWRIPLDEEQETERENLANAERFLIGMLNLINARFKLMAQPDLISQLAWHAVVRGWYVLRAYIQKDKNGATRPRVDVWDKLNTFYEMGDEGPLWICHLRTATASQLKAEYDVDIGTEKPVVYDFWDEEVNSVHIKGADFLKSPEEHGLDHLPALVANVGATPYIQSEEYTDTIKDVGESWLAANRGLIEPINELYSDLRTIVNRGAKVPLKHLYDSTKGQMPELSESPFKLDKGQVAVVPIDIGKGEDLTPFIEPTMPRDAAAIANIFGVLWQQGGLTNAAYGELPFQVSGYLFKQVTLAMGSVIGESEKSIDTTMGWLSRELLNQYSKGGFKPVTVEGRDDKDKYFGPIELKPEGVKGDWFPEFRLSPELPEDEMERYAMARIAHEGPDPLLSNLSINDRLLHVQDPDLEENIKLEQWAMNLPSIRLRRVANALMERGREDLAREVMNELARITAPPQGPKSEAVQPEFATGVPPEVMPPEMLGRTPTPPTPEVAERARLRRLGLERG